MYCKVLPPDQTLASVLRRLRQEREITQEALAFHANITVSTLARIERGVSNPTWTTLLKIADALDITPVALISATEDARQQTPDQN
jgi:transcriptional regulator with XRE-family HTH domain